MKIISCGCSFTYGSGPSDKSFMLGKVKNYSEFLQEMTSSELENFAFPGCSNYGIIKQVEHAVEKQPDLILFNTTTSMRYEIIRPDKCVEGEPHYKDFSSIKNIGGIICVYVSYYQPIKLGSSKIYAFKLISLNLHIFFYSMIKTICVRHIIERIKIWYHVVLTRSRLENYTPVIYANLMRVFFH